MNGYRNEIDAIVDIHTKTIGTSIGFDLIPYPEVQQPWPNESSDEYMTRWHSMYDRDTRATGV